MSLANQVKTRMQMAAANVDITRGEGGLTAPGAAQVPDRAALEKRYSDFYRETVSLLRRMAFRSRWCSFRRPT